MLLGHGGDKCWGHFTHSCISNQAEAGAAGWLGIAALLFQPLLLLAALCACYPTHLLFFTWFLLLSRWKLHGGPGKTPSHTKTFPRQPPLLPPAARPLGPQGDSGLLDTFGLTKTFHIPTVSFPVPSTSTCLFVWVSLWNVKIPCIVQGAMKPKYFWVFLLALSMCPHYPSGFWPWVFLQQNLLFFLFRAQHQPYISD